MGTPLKVSDDLVAAARREASATDRSITAQVEHWAKIGRSVEAALSHAELLGLKSLGEVLAPVSPTAVRRRRIHDVLERAARGDFRGKALAEIRAAGKPVFASDPERPGVLVRVHPDGRRERGHLVGRRFVRGEPAAKKK
jgi:hypothetical protein